MSLSLIITIVIESLAMCFCMLLVCVIGIANGPVGSVYYYEPEVQKRVLELGLITKEGLKKRKLISLIFLLIPMFIFMPAMVHFLNGARGFMEIFIQMCMMFLVYGLFDRLFIDWFWVGKTKAWIIPGTEDLMPYIPKKTIIRKWIGTIVIYPILAAIIALVWSLF